MEYIYQYLENTYRHSPGVNVAKQKKVEACNVKIRLRHLRNWLLWFFSSSSDHSRKRPLIVYDGSSSHSGPLKVKKPEGSIVPIGSNDRLKPPPAANLSNPIRKLSGNTSSSPSSQRSSDTTNLKREANTLVGTSLLSYSCTKKVIHKCSYCLYVWRYSKESVRTFIIKKHFI